MLWKIEDWQRSKLKLSRFPWFSIIIITYQNLLLKHKMIYLSFSSNSTRNLPVVWIFHDFEWLFKRIGWKSWSKQKDNGCAWWSETQLLKAEENPKLLFLQDLDGGLNYLKFSKISENVQESYDFSWAKCKLFQHLNTTVVLWEISLWDQLTYLFCFLVLLIPFFND